MTSTKFLFPFYRPGVRPLRLCLFCGGNGNQDGRDGRVGQTGLPGGGVEPTRFLHCSVRVRFASVGLNWINQQYLPCLRKVVGLLTLIFCSPINQMRWYRFVCQDNLGKSAKNWKSWKSMFSVFEVIECNWVLQNVFTWMARTRQRMCDFSQIFVMRIFIKTTNLPKTFQMKSNLKQNLKYFAAHDVLP